MAAARWTASCLAHLALGMNPGQQWTTLRHVDTVTTAKKK